MKNVLSLDSLRSVLAAHGQEHLLRFWGELDEAGRGQLAGQLSAIDWEQMGEWIGDYVLHPRPVQLPAHVEPGPYSPAEPATEEERRPYAEAVEHGRALIRAGRVAGFTVAGGQGTRLGYAGPKGTFPIAPVTGKTLFHGFAEALARAREKYGVVIPWYIMTSPGNDADTRAFLAGHDHFGLGAENVRFFAQGMLPAVGLDGRLLLGAKDSLALSPNGHGGSLLALAESGALADMRRRGVEHVSYWQVDNPLVSPLDPLFIGLHDRTGSDMSNRCLIKTGPFEKLGNFCLVDGRLTIIEYSDMPTALAEAKDAQGRLRFRAGSPAIHVLRRDFVERLTGGRLQLPLHRALKKVPYVDANGRLTEPTEPNAVKLEMFVFDALPLARRPLILEAVREEQFGPVKNPTGVDSVESCQALLTARAARWLERAGVPVPRRPDGSPDCCLELSPRRFLDADDVAAAAASLAAPARGEQRVYP